MTTQQCDRKPGAPFLQHRKRLRAYVAGPYRDKRGMYYVDKNINDARQVACELWAMGFAVVCPHTNTRFMDGYAGISDCSFLEGDLDLIDGLDILVMMPRWRESSGATDEHEYAAHTGKPIYYWDNPDDRHALKEIAA